MARILIVGTHPLVHQPSMQLFTGWLERALTGVHEVHVARAPALALNLVTRRWPVAKYLLYIDQYLLAPIMLAFEARRYDVVVGSDHSNAPTTVLVPAKQLAIMVHDTLAIRQARGEVPDTPPVGRPGRILQDAIVRSLRRAALLLANPGAVTAECRALGMTAPIAVVGCPIDLERLGPPGPAATAMEPFLLNVGGDGWRKRKRDLAPVMAEVAKRSSIGLTLAGRTEAATIADFDALGFTPKVLEAVPDEALGELYREATALITAAPHEGFCIPIVEALAFGKPVFVPDLGPSYLDFFGDAVIRLPMDDPARAADKLVEALAAPPPPGADTERVVEWSSFARFQERVREAVETLL